MRFRVIKNLSFHSLNRNNKHQKKSPCNKFNSVSPRVNFTKMTLLPSSLIVPRLLTKNFSFYSSLFPILHSILVVIVFVILWAAWCLVLLTIIALILRVRYVGQVVFVRWRMNNRFLSERFFICFLQ